MENENSRRDFIKKSAALALGTIAASTAIGKVLGASDFIEKESFTGAAGTFTLPKLPYEYDALEPHIDKMTMEIHYTKHHQAYVTNLNKALETVDTSLVGEVDTLDKIFDKVAKLPVAVRNNAGGHYNHSLFWTLMKHKGGGEPSGKGKLYGELMTHFGSIVEFKKQFAEAGMKRFGSGWVWLVANNGKVTIGTTANQDNPLMNTPSVEVRGTPILALDVWEHAYYLKNQNKRADYIDSWWSTVNWEVVEQLYQAAK